MSRLYSGFDALALGQAINNTNNNIHNNRMTGLQALGNSLQQYAKARREEDEKEAQRQSAIDFLAGNGMSQEKAQAMANSGINPGDLVNYMQGRLDKSADTADSRSYEEKIHGRDRGEALSDRDAQWAHDFDLWAKQNRITSKQAIANAIFGQLMSNRGLIISKDYGNSRARKNDMDENNAQLKDFMAKNPDYSFALKLMNDSSIDSNDGYYDEDIDAGLRKRGGKDFTDDQREEYLKDLMDHGKLNYIMENPYFRDAILAFGANVDKKNLMKQVNLQRLLGGNTTETQRKNEIKASNKAARINDLYDQILKAYRNQAEFPEVTEDELNELKKKFGRNQKYLNHYTRK